MLCRHVYKMESLLKLVLASMDDEGIEQISEVSPLLQRGMFCKTYCWLP